MLRMPIKDTLVYASYYAPRGRRRMYILGSQLSQKYLYPSDLIIGVIGNEGSGKSTLIKGLFPGLELTNDDEGVNLRPCPIFNFSEDDFFSGHTFHLDIRYESAFRQKFEIVDAINKALSFDRRVIIEHFELIYDQLGYNAQVLFGIGEEVRVYRPSIFGPSPHAVKKRTEEGLRYRQMTHSAEDLVQFILSRDHGFVPSVLHSDVRHGFVIGFPQKPDMDLNSIEQKVLEMISQDIPITPDKGDYIRAGNSKIYCTGKRIHVKSAGQIENFRLVKEFIYDKISGQYLLVGIVGNRTGQDDFDQKGLIASPV